MKHMHVYTRKILAKEYISAQTYTNGDTDSKQTTMNLLYYKAMIAMQHIRNEIQSRLSY